MTAEEFVARLDADNQRLLSHLAPDDTLRPEVEGDLNVRNLLKVALKNEIEATEIAGRWLVTTAMKRRSDMRLTRGRFSSSFWSRCTWRFIMVRYISPAFGRPVLRSVGDGADE